MRWSSGVGALALSVGCLIGLPALADDWQVAEVAGSAYRLEGTAWVRVGADDQIALGQMVKTLGSGRLTLTRSGVTVTVAPNSRIQLSERQDGAFTDVLQTAGTAEVEVDPKKHIRLAVETPYMAAVVKGTVFTVSTYSDHSQTSVARGRVAVIDVRNRLTADVTAGQSATSGPSQSLTLSGSGALEAPKPFKGKVYSRSIEGALTEMTGETDGTAEAGKSGGNSENSNAGGNSANSNAGGNGNSSSSRSSSNAGGNSNGAGNSENSNAGGKAK
ncbi:MAG: uncharacterized protein H6Q99_3735 [Proteobacteria bacterium]|nr:uncharacterized protein [Pseudomonadota bacterium]